MNNILEIIHKTKIKHFNLYFFSKSKKKNDYDAFSTNIEDLEIVSDIKDKIHKQLFDYLESEETEDVIDYNPIFEDNNIVQKIECEELKILPDFINKIEGDPQLYNENKLKKGHSLSLIVIMIDDGENRVFALQKIRNKTFLENKKITLSVENKIGKIDKPILPLENKIDCICSLNDDKSMMYIFNKYYFEQIFGFEEKFKNEIKKRLDILKKQNDERLVKLDIDKLYSKIENNKNSLKKLYVILENKNFKYLTEKNIQKIENKSDNIKFNRSNGELHLNEYEDIKKILNLLNDDYLEGIISQKPFRTSNKMNL